MIAPRDARARILRPEWLLALLLASHAFISQWQFSGQQACIDYYQFWVVGRAVAARELRDVYSDAERKRVGELYFQRALAEARAASPQKEKPAPTPRLQAAAQRQVLETYSTPWLYTVLGAASLADYQASQTAFQRVSLILYLAAIALIARLLRASPLALALWVVVLIAWFNPYLDDVVAGNVNRLQLFLLAAFLSILARARAAPPAGPRSAWPIAIAGTVLGTSLAFKPNLAAAAAACLLGWAAAGEIRKLLVAASGLAVGLAASVFAAGAYFGGLSPWLAWIAELPRLTAPGAAAAGTASEGNFSLARLLQPVGGLSVGRWIAVVLFAAIAAALLIERRRRRASERNGSGPERAIVLVGLGSALSLLASELSWQHYYVAVVPLAMVLLRPGEGDGAPSLLVRVLAVVGVALVSLQNVGRLLDLEDPRAAAAVMSVGVLALFVAGLADLARPRVESAHAPT